MRVPYASLSNEGLLICVIWIDSKTFFSWSANALRKYRSMRLCDMISTYFYDKLRYFRAICFKQHVGCIHCTLRWHWRVAILFHPPLAANSLSRCSSLILKLFKENLAEGWLGGLLFLHNSNLKKKIKKWE